jgi:MarR family transcriptional regulator for hemolysin
MGPVTHDEMAADLMFLLTETSHTLLARTTLALADLGITPRDQCVLTTALSGELTQGEVAEISRLDKTTMVVTLDALEAAGLAERRPSPTDRRARLVAVTPKGRKVAARAQEIVAGVYDEVLATLPARQRAVLVEGLLALVTGPLAPGSVPEAPIRRPRAS